MVRIREIKEKELFWVLKSLAKMTKNIQSLRTSYSDDELEAEYKLAIAISKRVSKDLDEFEKIDLNLDWGCSKEFNGDGLWFTKKTGDFNPWYQGELELSDLIESLSKLNDFLISFLNPQIEEIEFLHYYESIEKYYRKQLKIETPIVKKPVKKRVVRRKKRGTDIWWKRPDVVIPIIIAFLSIPWISEVIRRLINK